jgi:hypothetical protein
MPLLNNAEVAASFKTTGTTKQANENDQNQGKTNRSGIVTNKNELVKQELLTGMTVLQLVFPMTDESIYADLPEATTKQALDTIIGIIEYQEENLELVGNQEWMEEWPSQDNPHKLLSNISKLGSATVKDYFQRGSENVGGYLKEVWQFAIAGSADKDGLLKNIKWTLNEEDWRITINENYFTKINFYYAGWLSGADPEVLQLSNVGSAINQSMKAINPVTIKVEVDESGCDHTPAIGIQTVRYTASVTDRSKMSSPMYMITCTQKNLTQVRRLLSMLNRNYPENGFNEFVSNKATLEHCWAKLGEHIAFYSNKKYFFVAGEGLTNTKRSTVLSEQVTHQGQKSTLRDLLSSKKIFTFIQHSRSGGCKIICQYDEPTIIRSKGRTETLNVREWFSANIIRTNTDPAGRLDWHTKKFEPRWTFKLGAYNNPESGTSKPTDNTGKAWTANWRVQKDERSAISKLSSNGESIKTIKSQLAIQQEENKRLIDLNKKIKETTAKEAKEREAKWQSHASSESAAWADKFEREKIILLTATNQTIQNHEAMNAHLKRENELIKARCDTQESQQNLMMKQIADLTAAQNRNTERNNTAIVQMEYKQHQDKRDTPTTPTEMTNSPSQIQKTQKTDIAPHNLLETLSKPIHHTPTQSRSLAAISETAQGKTRNSPGRKHTTTTTSYAKGTTGGNQN